MVMVTKGHNEKAKDQTSQYGINTDETKERQEQPINHFTKDRKENKKKKTVG